MHPSRRRPRIELLGARAGFPWLLRWTWVREAVSFEGKTVLGPRLRCLALLAFLGACRRSSAMSRPTANLRLCSSEQHDASLARKAELEAAVEPLRIGTNAVERPLGEPLHQSAPSEQVAAKIGRAGSERASDDRIAEVDGVDLALGASRVVRRIHVDVRDVRAAHSRHLPCCPAVEHDLADEAGASPQLCQGIALDVVATEHLALAALFARRVAVLPRISTRRSRTAYSVARVCPCRLWLSD